MDPLTTLAASTIAKLAFDEFIKSGASELAKKTITRTSDLAKTLREKIRLKFEESEKANAILVEVENQRTVRSLEKLAGVLDVAMSEDEAFSNQIQQLAHQMINIQNQNQSTTELKQQNINQGRDQFIINQPQGEIKLGG
jgi:hypothetical protein